MIIVNDPAPPRITHVNGRRPSAKTAESSEQTRVPPSTAGDPDKVCGPDCCTPDCEPETCDPKVCDPDPCKPLCDPYPCDPDCVPNCGPDCAPDVCKPDCDPQCCPKQPTCSPDQPADAIGELTATGGITTIEEPCRFQPGDAAQTPRFARHVVFESGPVNGAILDFRTNRVLSLNPSGNRVAGRLRQGLNSRELTCWWQQCGRTIDELTRFCNELSEAEVLVESTEKPPGKRLEDLLDTNILNRGLQFLWLEITSGCNLRCTHCYAECGSPSSVGLVQLTNLRARENRPLSTTQFLEIISDAAQERCRMIQFIGGEPMMHPQLHRMIEHARQVGMTFIEVYSNGTRIDDDALSFFKRHGVHVAVSLYCHRADVHDDITGIPGSHALTLSALRQLLAADVPTRVGIVAMRENEAYVDDTVRFLRELGFSHVRVDGLRPSGRGANSVHAPVAYDAVQRRPDFRAFWREYVKNHLQNSCWHGKLAVSSTGDVMPCIFSRDQILGNLQQQSLRDVIDSPRTQSLWHITHDQVEPCRVCEYRYVCRDCRAISLNAKGDLYGQSPRCSYNPRTGRWVQPSETRISHSQADPATPPSTVAASVPVA